MSLAAALLEKIGSFFISILLGFIAVRSHALEFEDSKVLSRFALYIVTPCAMLDAFQYEFSTGKLMGLGIAMLGVLLATAAFALLAKLLTGPCRLSVVESCSLMYPNAGNFLLPLVASVLGPDWVIYCSPCFLVMNVGLFTHAQAVLSGEKKFRLSMLYKNVVLLSMLAGLIMFLLNIQLGGFVGDTVSSIGDMMGPVYMFTVGMIIGNADLKKVFSHGRAYLICLGRLLLCPLAALALFLLTGLTRIHPEAPRFLLVVFLAAGAPTAVMITQFTQLYRSVPEAEAASVINILSTLLCLLTLPCLAWLYQTLVF